MGLKMEEEELGVRGSEKVLNWMGGGMCGNIGGIGKECMGEGVNELKGVEERVEKVGGVKGVDYMKE